MSSFSSLNRSFFELPAIFQWITSNKVCRNYWFMKRRFASNSIFFLHKLNNCHRNYSKDEIVQWKWNYSQKYSNLNLSCAKHSRAEKSQTRNKIQHLFSNFTKLLFILKEEFSFLHDSFDMHDCSSPLQCSFVIFATSSHSSSVTPGIPGLY